MPPSLASDHYPANVLPLLVCYIHRDQETIAAGAQRDFSKSALLCLERVRVAAIAQHKPFEVSEAVEHHLADFPCVFVFVAFRRAFGRYTVWRWFNAAGVTSQAVDSSRKIADVAL